MPNTRTIDYAALERATGVRKDDTRSDIYFLGCIFYHMLTGQPPLVETRDRLQRLNKQRFLDVVPIQKLNRSCRASVTIVANKAIMFDPDRRYQTPLAMLNDLRSVAKRLAGAASETDEAAESGNSDGQRDASTDFGSADAGRSVMVVESDVKTQDIFRKSFKQAGYRVFVTADPGRAAGRFRQDSSVADCIVFSASKSDRWHWICSTSWARIRGPSRCRPSCCSMRARSNGNPRPTRPGTVSC